MTIGAISPDIDTVPIGAPIFPQPILDTEQVFSDVLRTSLGSNGRANLDAIFDDAAQRYDIPVNLLKAVAKTESNFQPDVTSKAGAMGIMQLMPGTAGYLGVTDPFDPAQNIMGGARYLREMLDRFGGSVDLALAAYNAGPNNVEKYSGIPPFSETQNYVRTVMDSLGGGNIVAGTVKYGGLDTSSSGKASDQSGLSGLGNNLSQMMLLKIIEMQMNSLDDDKDKKIF